MIFSEEGMRRLEHIADGKPVPKDEDHIKAWDRMLTIDVPQDSAGTFTKPMRARIWQLVEHVRRGTTSCEARVLAAGICAVIEELQKLGAPPVKPEPTWEPKAGGAGPSGFGSLRGTFLGPRERDDE